MNIYQQKFLVLGVSKSGRAVGEYILNRGGKCFFYEELKSPKIDTAITELTSLGGVMVSRENVDKILEDVDVVVVSPGVPINHDVCVKAKKLYKKIIGELEFGFSQFTPTTVAVTGTNGKTTTVSLIEWIFKSANKPCRIVGNIGYPVTAEIDSVSKSEVLITEVSSFQLETVHSFKPHIACLLNISPDHLDRHYTMENYVFLKKRILQNLTESEYAVLNYDDEIIKGFVSDIKCKPVWISTNQSVFGAYIANDKLYYNDEYIIEKKDLSLKGLHNEYNSLFAIAVCKLFGLSACQISEGLKTFKGVKYRMELVYEKKGIRYINDSKSTNTGSTITAISSMNSPTILILGGSDKGENYKKLFQRIKELPIKQVILTGETRLKMLSDSVEVGYNDITVTANFTSAVKIANMFAESGDSVLLSPACASFDAFLNYEERGELFNKLVIDFNE